MTLRTFLAQQLNQSRLLEVPHLTTDTTALNDNTKRLTEQATLAYTQYSCIHKKT